MIMIVSLLLLLLLSLLSLLLYIVIIIVIIIIIVAQSTITVGGCNYLNYSSMLHNILQIHAHAGCNNDLDYC
jgi:hypothetical protein